MRRRWIMHPETHELVPAEEYVRPAKAVSSLPRPMLIRDQMEPTLSMADGKVYESKSAMRAEYKARGMIEVGNDTAPMWERPKAPPPREEIRGAVEGALSKVGWKG